jgi:V-type H+-transporting ATPase subunit H
MIVFSPIPLFSTGGAAFCLASVLLVGDKLERESVLESFVSWMTARLQSSTLRALSVVTPSLTVLLVSRDAREIFNKAGGIGYIARHLRVCKTQSDWKHIGAGASVQQLYELCYCLWLMSFDCGDSQDIRNHFHRDGAVPALVDLVAAARREKIVRLALSTLRNLAVCKADIHAGSSTIRAMTGSMFLTEMIGCGLLKWIDLMKERQWKDPDLIGGKSRLDESNELALLTNLHLRFFK